MLVRIDHTAFFPYFAIWGSFQREHHQFSRKLSLLFSFHFISFLSSQTLTTSSSSSSLLLDLGSSTLRKKPFPNQRGLLLFHPYPNSHALDLRIKLNFWSFSFFLFDPFFRFFVLSTCGAQHHLLGKVRALALRIHTCIYVILFMLLHLSWYMITRSSWFYLSVLFCSFYFYF